MKSLKVFFKSIYQNISYLKELFKKYIRKTFKYIYFFIKKWNYLL